MSIGFDRFATYRKVSDRMIELASKDDVVETAKILAVHLAHYRAKHGEIPIQKTFDLLLTESLSDEQAGALADGFEVLVKVMAAVRSPAQGSH